MPCATGSRDSYSCSEDLVMGSGVIIDSLNLHHGSFVRQSYERHPLAPSRVCVDRTSQYTSSSSPQQACSHDAQSRHSAQLPMLGHLAVLLDQYQKIGA